MKIIIYPVVQILFLITLQVSEAQHVRSNLHLNCLCVPVHITTQPVSPSSICAGSGAVSFSAGVSGTGPFTYLWKENGTVISDGGAYSGSHTDTLTITNPSAALNGRNYQCVITNCNGQSVSSNNTAVLSVHYIPGDINTDGIVDNNDFSLMNLVYNTSCSNCPEDLIPDGLIDVKDFLQFLGYYNMSCQ